MKSYDHKEIEKKWQKVWEDQKIYEAYSTSSGQALDGSDKPKFYVLIEFPFPSGDGMHTGHLRSNTAMDIIARKRRAEGYNVLYPIGWDAFGLPTENYAIKTGVHPKIVTKKNTDTFRRQLKAGGFSFDWSREVDTSDPAYYKWTQWIFLQMFEKGLAYKKKMLINWCPKDKIGLANEEVIDGKCERCDTPVEKREKEQWMLAITKYADRLDKDLDDVNYLEKIKIQQRNWIGRSEGAEIGFRIVKSNLTPNPSPMGRGTFNYHTSDAQTWNALQDTAVEMRKNPTVTEEKLWQSLKGNATGSHIRRQHIIGKFIADFVCLEKSLVIEVDGDIHDHQKESDEERTQYLLENGFTVIRFKNEEIQNNLENVVEKIKTSLNNALPFGEGSGEVLKIFTTRPDTIFGATYMVVVPEHELVLKLKSQIENWTEVETYIQEAKKKDDIERTNAGKEKTGVELKGIKAINPATKEEIPIFVADYVLAHYGTGAIMAVPAHDERDYAFAKKYNLKIRKVIEPVFTQSTDSGNEVYVGKGIMTRSGNFDGLTTDKAFEKIIEEFGTKKITYKLRDWVFSRQRYWGEPIPMIYCEKCDWQPVAEKDLPVELPDVKNYEPTDTGESPLANIKSFVDTKCPMCGGPAKRETDTMPNWAGSSWYYLRYMDPKNDKEFASADKLKYWSPIDWYNGGMEHTTLHLLYSRFWHKFLFDLKLVPTSEPYQKRTAHGLILTEGGEKMSKSKGNVVNPDSIIDILGADTLRLYEMFMGPFDQAVVWSTDGIVGPRRFLERVWRLQEKLVPKWPFDIVLESVIHKTIKKVSEDIESMSFNTAVSSMMILVNEMEKREKLAMSYYKHLLQLLAPFTPFITEEIWAEIGQENSIHQAPWPKYMESKIAQDEVNMVVQVNGKVRGEFKVTQSITEAEARAKAENMPEIVKWIEGKEVVKVIFVPNRLVNIVVKPV